ncbi:30S ribosomal protein S6 [Candidatus Poribacteria bacterium]|nr:30S ribosomal protein S6 [Candidatus Poribacteria bacterium]
MLNKYEVVVVLDAARTEDDQKALLEKLEGVITSNGGKIESRDIWGRRRLAYPIRKRREGYYAVLVFEADTTSAVLAELNRHLRITEEILRSLVTEAVVGKSRGNPNETSAEHRFGGHGGSRYPRGPRSDGPRSDGPRRDRPAGSESAPAPAPAPVESPAPASSEAPAEEVAPGAAT